MSLAKKYKINARLARDGVWVDICTNSDGSKCRVRLRRSGRGNPTWMAAYRARTANVDLDAVSPEEDEIITAEIFTEACVVDWEYMQPDDDGNNVPFSKGAALEMLSNPEWIELFKELQSKASSVADFQDKVATANLERDAGN